MKNEYGEEAGAPNGNFWDCLELDSFDGSGPEFELERVRDGYESTDRAATNGLRLEADSPVVFNHNPGNSYKNLEEIEGIQMYTGRVLAVTEPGDKVHLSKELQEDHPVIKEHYDAIGLPTTTDIVWDMEPKPTPEGYKTSDFLFGDVAHATNPDQERFEAVREYNSKNKFVGKLQEEGHPTPSTNIYEHGEIPVQTFEGPWFVKGDVAASGTEVIKCDTWDEVIDAAASLEADYQVQQSVGENAAFLNVQYKASNGEAEFISTTEQVLNGFTHAGNIYPSQYNPRKVTDAVAEQAATDGLVGVFAFDVAITESGEEKIIECNPRPNGVTYPTAVAERLGIGEWSCVNVPTAKNLEESLEALERAGLIYSPEQGTGAVIVNWGTAQEGKLGILFAGSEPTQQKHWSAARRILGAIND